MTYELNLWEASDKDLLGKEVKKHKLIEFRKKEELYLRAKFKILNNGVQIKIGSVKRKLDAVSLLKKMKEAKENNCPSLRAFLVFICKYRNKGRPLTITPITLEMLNRRPSTVLKNDTEVKKEDFCFLQVGEDGGSFYDNYIHPGCEVIRKIPGKLEEILNALNVED